MGFTCCSEGSHTLDPKSLDFCQSRPSLTCLYKKTVAANIYGMSSSTKHHTRVLTLSPSISKPFATPFSTSPRAGWKERREKGRDGGIPRTSLSQGSFLRLLCLEGSAFRWAVPGA